MFNIKKKAISLTTAVTLVATAMVPMGTPVFAEENQPKIKEVVESDWTMGLYLCGSNLESEGGSATRDLIEILEADVPEHFSERVNILIQTGGSSSWHFKALYGDKLEKEGFSKNEIDQIIPEEIDGNRIQEYKVNFEHEYTTDEGEKNTVPTIELVKDVAIYPEVGKKEEIHVDENTVSMGNSKYLESFIEDMDNDYPAKYRMLDLWNHGGGITNGVCLDEKLRGLDSLTLKELLSALDNAQVEDNRFEIIGFDACLMSNYETWCRLAEYAYYGIGSLTAELGYGWYYTPFIEDLGKNLDNINYNGLELSQSIVKAFKNFYDFGGVYDKMKEDGIINRINLEVYNSFLCALDLDEFAKTYVPFAELSDCLVKLYADREGTENLKKLLENSEVFKDYNITGLDSFVDAVIANAESRIEHYTKDVDDNDGFAKYVVELYTREIESAKEFKERVNSNIIEEFSGRRFTDYEGFGVMSLFYPDHAKTTSELAFFTTEEYPEYSLNDNYSLFTYFIALENDSYVKEMARMEIEIDFENEEFTTVCPLDEKGYGAFWVKRYLYKDGKYYHNGFPHDNGKIVDDEFYSTYESMDYHFEINDEPFATEVVIDYKSDDNSYVVTGTLNGKSGNFYFRWNEEEQKCTFYQFFSDDFTVLCSDFKENDVITFKSELFDSLDRKKLFFASEQFIEHKFTVKESDLVERDGNRHGCILPVSRVVDDGKNVSYVGTVVYNASAVFSHDIDFEDMEYEHVCIDFNKYRDFENANVSIAEKEYELSGYAIEPEIIFEGVESNLEKDVDYEVIYENNIGIGRATATVRGLGVYANIPDRVIEFDIVEAKKEEAKEVIKTVEVKTVEVKTVEVKKVEVKTVEGKTVVVKAPKQVKIKSVKNKKKKALTVKWKKIKDASGYEVCIARNKKFTKAKKVKTIKNVNKASLKIKKLKKNKTYFVKVRAYTFDPSGNKVYGDWSEVEKIKIKK